MKGLWVKRHTVHGSGVCEKNVGIGLTEFHFLFEKAIQVSPPEAKMFPDKPPVFRNPQKIGIYLISVVVATDLSFILLCRLSLLVRRLFFVTVSETTRWQNLSAT